MYYMGNGRRRRSFVISVDNKKKSHGIKMYLIIKFTRLKKTDAWLYKLGTIVLDKVTDATKAVKG